MVLINSSSLFCCSLARVENTLGKPSSACFFHCAICVACTPYSMAISFAVLYPLMASNATFVFSSTLYRLRCLAIDFLLLVLLSIQLFYLISLSRKLGPLYYPTLQSTVTPDRSNTSNQEYTASDILQDFIISGASPTVLDHNQTIWSWTSELGSPYYIAVHAKSSVTFRDASGCSGPCDGFLNGGIWVYSDYATAYQAYIDATKDQEQQMQTPPTGPKTIPSVYRHGRCLLLGPGNDSIYTSVVTQYCV